MTLDCRARVLWHEGRSVPLPRRHACLLIAMERCRPGFVSDRVLRDLRATSGPFRSDGKASAEWSMKGLRRLLATIGVRDVIQRIWRQGYRLTASVRLLDIEATDDEWAPIELPPHLIVAAPIAPVTAPPRVGFSMLGGRVNDVGRPTRAVIGG